MKSPEDFKPTAITTAAVSGAAKTRLVHVARPQTQALEPALADSLAAKRRAEALHAASEPRTMTAASCVLSCDT